MKYEADQKHQRGQIQKFLDPQMKAKLVSYNSLLWLVSIRSNCQTVSTMSNLREQLTQIHKFSSKYEG